MFHPVRRAALALALGLVPGLAAAEGVDCVIVPAVNVKLRAPVSGLIDHVHVDQGDVVEPGTLIATLRSEVERTALEVLELQAGSEAEIEAQKSRLLLSEKRLERIRTMAARSLTPKEELDSAEAETEVIKRELAIAEMRRQVVGLELDRARQQLAQHEIHIPIHGVVVDRALYDGEFLQQDGYVVTIAQIDPLKVDACLPVSLYRSVSTGDADRPPRAAGGGDLRGHGGCHRPGV